MLQLTAGRVGSLLARRSPAALTTSSARMASHGHVLESVDMSRPLYVDSLDLPLPDRPYKTVLTDAERKLKQKEKGPWSQLSKEEKIALYRLKFCKTFSEIQQRSAEWKTVLGGILYFLGFTGLLVLWQSLHVFPERPRTFDDDWQAKQLKRMLDMRMNPIQGLASQWDYEKGQWK